MRIQGDHKVILKVFRDSETARFSILVYNPVPLVQSMKMASNSEWI